MTARVYVLVLCVGVRHDVQRDVGESVELASIDLLVDLVFQGRSRVQAPH